eukprot:GHVP01058940.1.p1 GENE.GHVP01058940.1~~GHVP01058940.1.p1  ORF type:complete len:929 (+),score=197.13 GHVP01058940.1:218-2788(+)
MEKILLSNATKPVQKFLKTKTEIHQKEKDLKTDIGKIETILSEISNKRNKFKSSFSKDCDITDEGLSSEEEKQKTLQKNIIKCRDKFSTYNEEIKRKATEIIVNLRSEIAKFNEDSMAAKDEITENLFLVQILSVESNAFERSGMMNFFEYKLKVLQNRKKILRNQIKELEKLEESQSIIWEQKIKDIKKLIKQIDDNKIRINTAINNSVEINDIWKDIAKEQNAFEQTKQILENFAIDELKLHEKIKQVSLKLGMFDLADLDPKTLCRTVADEIEQYKNEITRLDTLSRSLADKSGQDYLRKAFGELGLFQKQKKETNLKINLIPLSECLPDGTKVEPYEMTMKEISGEGYLGPFRITLQNQIEWGLLVARISLGFAQICIGAFLTVYSMGIVSSMSTAFVSEGISDIWDAIYEGVYLRKEFSWSEYAFNKGISYGLAIAFAGIGTLKDVAKTAYSGVKSVCQRVVGSAKTCAVAHGKYLLKKKIVFEIGTKVLDKVITKINEVTLQKALVNTITDIFLSNSKKEYENLVTENEIAKKLLAIDKKKGNSFFLQHMKDLFYKIVNPKSWTSGISEDLVNLGTQVWSKILQKVNEAIYKMVNKFLGEGFNQMCKKGGVFGFLLKCAKSFLQSLASFGMYLLELIGDIKGLFSSYSKSFTKALQKEAENKSSTTAKGISEYNKNQVEEEEKKSVVENVNLEDQEICINRRSENDTPSQVIEKTEKQDLDGSLTKFMTTVTVEKTKSIINKHIAYGFRKAEYAARTNFTAAYEKKMDEKIDKFKEERVRHKAKQGETWRLRKSQKTFSKEERAAVENKINREADGIFDSNGAHAEIQRNDKQNNDKECSQNKQLELLLH